MNIQNLAQLQLFFAEHDTPLQIDGERNRKSACRLLTAIQNNEVELIPYPRAFAQSESLVIVDIWYLYNNKVILHLVEGRRVNFDGGVENINKHNIGIRNRMKIGEDPIDAAARCIKEKLGFYQPLPVQLISIGEKQIFTDGGYPCPYRLETRNHISCQLPDQLFDPRGYSCGRQSRGKTSYFEWVSDTGSQIKPGITTTDTTTAVILPMLRT